MCSDVLYMHHSDHIHYYYYNNGYNCYFSRSAAIKSTSERKPLPLKSGSCLDILKPSKPPVEDKTVNQSKPPPPASESVCYVYHNIVLISKSPFIL